METKASTTEHGPTDGDLLIAFVQERSQDAFAQLIHRHSAMVFGVCQRVLGNAHDSEDASQMVFLVLSRKAESLSDRSTVAGWLYRVAWFVAKRSKKALMRRNQYEGLAAEQAHADSKDEDAQTAVLDALHDELKALPDKYRMPVILHHLQGYSEQESADLLACKRGTLSGRLSRARRLLQERLTKRGLATVSIAGLTAVMSQSVKAQLAETFTQQTSMNALALASGNSASLLTNGVTTPMLATIHEAAKFMDHRVIYARLALSLAVGCLLLLIGLVVSRPNPTLPETVTRTDIPPAPATADPWPATNVMAGPAMLTVGALQADFTHLREKLEEIHPHLYLHRTREETEALAQEIQKELESPIDRVAFYKQVARYTTSFQDGHTFPSMGFASRQYRRSLAGKNTILPIELDFKDRGFYIKTVHADEWAPMVGASLMAINGNSAQEIITAYQSYYAKRASLYDNAHARLFREYYWLAFGESDRWRIRYQHEGKAVAELDLPGLTEDAFKRLKETSRKATDPAPDRFRWRVLDDDPPIALITVDVMGDFDRFASFLESTFMEIQRKNVRHLVIDLRNNGGGSSRLGDELYAYLSDKPYIEGKMQVKISAPVQDWYRRERPEHPLHDFVMEGEIGTLVDFPVPPQSPRKVTYPFRGDCYLLIGPKTYSSGHMFAGLFKGNHLGAVIGQPTGQATKTPGDAFSFRLPNSNIRISVSYKLFEGPCEPSLTEGFQPHHRVTYSSEELAQGIDKELELARKLIAESAN